MAPRKRSETWNHFSELENSKAKCGYCSKILSTAGGSFGNLNLHLKTVHPAVLFSKAKEIMDLDENLVDNPASQGTFYSVLLLFSYYTFLYSMYQFELNSFMWYYMNT